MSDDIVGRLRIIDTDYDTFFQQRLMYEAADEIVRLRALADQLAEALDEVSQITKVLHGRGDMADCLIRAFIALAAHEAQRGEGQ